jgi:glutaminyl-peptide cyclotransferase
VPATPDTPAAPTLDRRTKWGIFLGVAVLVAAIAVLAWLSRAGAIIPFAQDPARQMRVEVIASYPHDPGAFTQGLLYHDGVLYESTGLEGESTLRRVDLKTGRVLQTVALPPPLFAEGLALAPQGLIQVTWQNDTGFVYDPATLALRRQFKYAGDGWGLCYDGTSLAMTDGSDTLAFRAPDTFAVQRSVRVVMNGTPLRSINELECANRSVYANVWHKDFIVRIDPATIAVRTNPVIWALSPHRPLSPGPVRPGPQRKGLLHGCSSTSLPAA